MTSRRPARANFPSGFLDTSANARYNLSIPFPERHTAPAPKHTLSSMEAPMAGLNKVMLIGHLGNDPEMRFTQSGMAVAKFRLATSERTKDGGEKTEWHRIVAFDRLAEICGDYLHKGKQVYIEGRIQTSEYEDKDGVRRWSTDIIANTMQMLGSKGDSPGGPPQGGGYRQRSAQGGGSPYPDDTPQDMPGPSYSPPAGSKSEDDIPF
jgi:single-strand DNA-binding protein